MKILHHRATRHFIALLVRVPLREEVPAPAGSPGRRLPALRHGRTTWGGSSRSSVRPERPSGAGRRRRRVARELAPPDARPARSAGRAGPRPRAPVAGPRAAGPARSQPGRPAVECRGEGSHPGRDEAVQAVGPRLASPSGCGPCCPRSGRSCKPRRGLLAARLRAHGREPGGGPRAARLHEVPDRRRHRPPPGRAAAAARGRGRRGRDRRPGAELASRSSSSSRRRRSS